MRERWRSVNSALAWAFRVLEQDVIQHTSAHRMMGGGRDGARDGLTAYERHAQASLMVAPAASMTGLERAYCRYRWGGIKDQDPDWGRVYDYVRVNGMWSVAPRRGLWKLMLRYRGEHIGVHALRRDLGCGMGSVMDYQETAFAILNDLDDRVRPKLEARLYEAGLIEEI
jgi:hypothetical protein